MKVIYEDNHLLVVDKPAGQLVQGDRTRRLTLLDEGKSYLKDIYDKPGNVFLALVHRLDRLASGVVVMARTSKSAARLSDEIRSHRAKKTDWAQVYGCVPESGEWIDPLLREEYTSRVVDDPSSRVGELSFNRLSTDNNTSTVEIDLKTGRHHQIRVQFAHRGHPILGDKRYGSKLDLGRDRIALHAKEMRIKHPTHDEEMSFVSAPPEWGQSLP